MQNRVLAHETLQKIGETAQLFGWIERVRSHGKIAFFDLRDRSGVIQVVAATQEIAVALGERCVTFSDA